MKKNGFTLAEVLVVLGVIGVVAALTLPTLMSNTQESQVGPKLAKAVSMFEQANESLLAQYDVDALGDTGLMTSTSAYGSELSNYLKIVNDSGSTYLSKDGMSYTLTISSNTAGNDTPHKQKIGSVVIDINGNDSPNTSGGDKFDFTWWNDGSLRPQGSKEWDGGANDTTWTTNCKSNETPTDYTYCAGSIFENNLKVLYKMP
jgi:prepilin-type N-terminal cleavage/methylation domain-containing protein